MGAVWGWRWVERGYEYAGRFGAGCPSDADTGAGDRCCGGGGSGSGARFCGSRVWGRCVMCMFQVVPGWCGSGGGACAGACAGARLGVCDSASGPLRL